MNCSTTYAAIALMCLATLACNPEKPTGTKTDSLHTSAGMIPSSAKIERVNEIPMDPEKDSLSDDKHVSDQIKYGYQIVRYTRKYAGQYVGDSLDCVNCHLNAGQRDKALPYVGVASAFPMYRPRTGRMISLEERIRDCFMRSLNGTQPPYDSKELMAVAAYITWLSKGHPMGAPIAWRDKNKIPKEKEIPIAKLDVKRGDTMFVELCSSCHGRDGQGVDISLVKPGPLWGPNSWNDGAAMSRIYILAGFIRYAMPLTNPGSLSDEDAQHIAAFINSHERPNFPNKELDYPGIPVPVDAVYYPQYKKNPLMQ